MFFFSFFYSTNCHGGPDKKGPLQCLPGGQVSPTFTHERGSASFELCNLPAPRAGLLSPACVGSHLSPDIPKVNADTSTHLFSSIGVCVFFIISGLWTFVLFLASLTIHYSFLYFMQQFSVFCTRKDSQISGIYFPIFPERKPHSLLSHWIT